MVALVTAWRLDGQWCAYGGRNPPMAEVGVARGSRAVDQEERWRLRCWLAAASADEHPSTSVSGEGSGRGAGWCDCGMASWLPRDMDRGRGRESYRA
jgi:hypothetical protein